MTDESFLNLLKQARAEGERFGFAIAVAIVRGYLNSLREPDMADMFPPDQLAARVDQLERVLRGLAEQELEL